MLSVNLALNDSPLEEVIFRGYYFEKKLTQVGNVTKIKGDDIRNQPVNDPMLALQGRVAGLRITQFSGMPGAPPTIQLRGQNSIAGNNDPLYIVDGIQFPSTPLSSFIGIGAIRVSPFNSLNPADIESIEVLKDADATSIYGARGANGVILITTRSAKAGKMRATVNIDAGVGKVTRKRKLMNTRQYLDMRYEAFNNDGIDWTQPDVFAPDLKIWDTTRYTDWQDVLIGNTANYLNADASLSGGNAITNYNVGINYNKATTVFPGNFYNQKYSAYINISNSSINKKFNSRISVSYVKDDHLMPSSDISGSIFLPPNAPALYDSIGNLNWENGSFSNPLAGLKKRSTTSTANLITNLRLSYEIIKGLSFSSSFGYNAIILNQSTLTPSVAFSPALSGLSSVRSSAFASVSRRTWNLEPQINYINNIGGGKLDFTTGVTVSETVGDEVGITAINFPSDAAIQNISSAVTVFGSNRFNQYRYTALFGRINYNYEDRYIINITGRRDGSSRFGPNNRFGNFGAIGAGWVVSRERFVEKSLGFLSFGKLRASYGTNGNEPLLDYQYLSTYSSGPEYLNVAVYSPTRIANPNYRWERQKKLEVGLELGFLNNRILLSTSFYRNNTLNQLVPYSLPAITGFESLVDNIPANIRNSGVELEINTVNVKSKHFSWSTSINLSIPRNVLVSYENLESSIYATRYEIGKSLFLSRKYHFTGVDPQTGLYQFEDVNKDGVLTVDDLQGINVVTSKYFGGFQNTFSYKQFQLDFLFEFVKKNGTNHYFNSNLFGGTANQPVEVLHRWRKPGDISQYQAVSQNFGSQASSALDTYLFSSDGRIADASFIRLRNLSFSYNLPSFIQNKLRIQGLKFFVRCQNLLTFTKFRGGDPENGSTNTVIPPLRMATAGFSITL